MQAVFIAPSRDVTSSRAPAARCDRGPGSDRKPEGVFVPRRRGLDPALIIPSPIGNRAGPWLPVRRPSSTRMRINNNLNSNNTTVVNHVTT